MSVNQMTKQIVVCFFFTLALMGCESNKEEDKHNSEQKETEVYYTCAMHPHIKEDKPGRCPICNMTLTKVEIEPAGHEGHALMEGEEKTEEVNSWFCKDYPDVTSQKEDTCPIDGTPMVQVVPKLEVHKKIADLRLREAQIKHFSPAVIPVEKMKLSRQLRLLGSVTQSEEGEAYIPTRVEGRIEKVYVQSTGSYIQRNDPVVDIYSPQLITGGEEYLIARKKFEKDASPSATALLEQTQERLTHWGVGKAQMDRWFQNNRVPRNITLYSGASGIVREKKAIEGRYFQRGSNLFTLSDLSQVWVEMDVYEQESALVHYGQKVRLQFSALPGKMIEGEIDFISPVLDLKTRTLKVRTTIDNKEGKLKPGMVSDVSLQLQREHEVLVVPRSAIIDTGIRKVVWVQQSPKMYQALVVHTGFESEGYVEIIHGLQEADPVVVDGNFLLDAQAQLFGGFKNVGESPPEHIH